MKGWIAQDSGGLITFFVTKPYRYYLDFSKKVWWWVVDEGGGPTFHLNNPIISKRELLPNKAVNHIHLIDMLGFKRKKDNKEGFGQWEGVSMKEPREVELNLELV